MLTTPPVPSQPHKSCRRLLFPGGSSEENLCQELFQELLILQVKPPKSPGHKGSCGPQPPSTHPAQDPAQTVPGRGAAAGARRALAPLTRPNPLLSPYRYHRGHWSQKRSPKGAAKDAPQAGTLAAQGTQGAAPPPAAPQGGSRARSPGDGRGGRAGAAALGGVLGPPGGGSGPDTPRSRVRGQRCSPPPARHRVPTAGGERFPAPTAAPSRPGGGGSRPPRPLPGGRRRRAGAEPVPVPEGPRCSPRPCPAPLPPLL